ncbi:MAG TPA: PhoU domain-containing protein, partial [bacterium]|nr:PhoU domain-containing protein [bacterium]
MKAQFTEQLGQLEKLVIEMGSVVESQVNNVVTALLTHNSELAQTVIKQDETVDALEMQIDEA